VKQLISDNLEKAVAELQAGNIIAYPTEAVFGLGCDPFNETAVLQLLALKNRAVEKGLILIVANWQQLEPLITPVDEIIKQKILQQYDHPITWVLPANEKVPEWIRGKHHTVAIRICEHPFARKLCELFGGAIVSTSANLEGRPPAKTAEEVARVFESLFIVEGEVGEATSPSEIRDALTYRQLRV